MAVPMSERGLVLKGMKVIAKVLEIEGHLQLEWGKSTRPAR